jgi:hypothetical protein
VTNAVEERDVTKRLSCMSKAPHNAWTSEFCRDTQHCRQLTQDFRWAGTLSCFIDFNSFRTLQVTLVESKSLESK